MTDLKFEKPIKAIYAKIDELKKLSLESGMNLEKEIESFEKQAEEYQNELYSKLSIEDKLLITRHSDRPNFLEYMDLMCEDFIEFHGDRMGCDDRSIIGGLAKLDGKPIMFVGTQKGKNTKENLEYNFGMPQPQGYRKAMRLFEHASKFGIPIVTLVDTPGAYPGVSAEATGQGIAIAMNLRDMAKLKVPVISVITGEGCSGGALGIAVANEVLMLEYAYYTVISPEGCASILWRDASLAATAAEALKISAQDLLKLNIIDGIVKEPMGGAHNNHQEMADNLKKSILESLKKYSKMSASKLKEQRYNKYRVMGEFVE